MQYKNVHMERTKLKEMLLKQALNIRHSKCKIKNRQAFPNNVVTLQNYVELTEQHEFGFAPLKYIIKCTFHSTQYRQYMIAFFNSSAVTILQHSPLFKGNALPDFPPPLPTTHAHLLQLRICLVIALKCLKIRLQRSP